MRWLLLSVLVLLADAEELDGADKAVDHKSGNEHEEFPKIIGDANRPRAQEELEVDTLAGYGRTGSVTMQEVDGGSDDVVEGSHLSDVSPIEAIGRYRVDSATSQVTKDIAYVKKPPLFPPRAQIPILPPITHSPLKYPSPSSYARMYWPSEAEKLREENAPPPLPDVSPPAYPVAPENTEDLESYEENPGVTSPIAPTEGNKRIAGKRLQSGSSPSYPKSVGAFYSPSSSYADQVAANVSTTAQPREAYKQPRGKELLSPPSAPSSSVSSLESQHLAKTPDFALETTELTEPYISSNEPENYSELVASPGYKQTATTGGKSAEKVKEEGISSDPKPLDEHDYYAVAPEGWSVVPPKEVGSGKTENDNIAGDGPEKNGIDSANNNGKSEQRRKEEHENFLEDKEERTANESTDHEKNKDDSKEVEALSATEENEEPKLSIDSRESEKSSDKKVKENNSSENSASHSSQLSSERESDSHSEEDSANTTQVDGSEREDLSRVVPSKESNAYEDGRSDQLTTTQRSALSTIDGKGFEEELTPSPNTGDDEKESSLKSEVREAHNKPIDDASSEEQMKQSTSRKRGISNGKKVMVTKSAKPVTLSARDAEIANSNPNVADESIKASKKAMAFSTVFREHSLKLEEAQLLDKKKEKALLLKENKRSDHTQSNHTKYFASSNKSESTLDKTAPFAVRIEMESTRSEEHRLQKEEINPHSTESKLSKRKKLVMFPKKKNNSGRMLSKDSLATSDSFTAPSSHVLASAQGSSPLKHSTDEFSPIPKPKHLSIGEIWKGFPRPQKPASKEFPLNFREPGSVEPDQPGDISLTTSHAKNLTVFPEPKKLPYKEFPLDFPQPKTVTESSTVSQTAEFSSTQSQTADLSSAQTVTKDSSTFPKPRKLPDEEFPLNFSESKQLENPQLQKDTNTVLGKFPRPKKLQTKEFPLDIPKPKNGSANYALHKLIGISSDRKSSKGPFILPKPRGLPTKEFPLDFPEPENELLANDKPKGTSLDFKSSTGSSIVPKPKKLPEIEFPLNFPEPEESVSTAPLGTTTASLGMFPKPRKLSTTLIPLKFELEEPDADPLAEPTTLPSKHLSVAIPMMIQGSPSQSDSIDALPSNVSSISSSERQMKISATVTSSSPEPGNETLSLSEVIRPSDIAGKPLLVTSIRPSKSVVTPSFTFLDKTKQLLPNKHSGQDLTLALSSNDFPESIGDQSLTPRGLILNVPLPQLLPLNITISRRTIRKHRKSARDSNEDSQEAEKKRNEKASVPLQAEKKKNSPWKIKMIPKAPLATTTQIPSTKSLSEPNDRIEAEVKSDLEESIDPPPFVKLEEDDTLAQSTVDPFTEETTLSEAKSESFSVQTTKSSLSELVMEDRVDESDEEPIDSDSEKISIEDQEMLTTTERFLPEAPLMDEDDAARGGDRERKLKMTNSAKRSDLPEPSSDYSPLSSKGIVRRTHSSEISPSSEFGLSTGKKWMPYEFDCDNEVDEKGALCRDWAAGGLCSMHRPTMFLFCRKTCLCVGPSI